MIAPSQSERMDLPTTSESIFCKGGLLEKEAFMRHRSQQENMAYFCAQSFESDSPLLFEAGTGVGKTLAYLINAVIFAKKHGRKLYVSTHTMALQEQIVKKDLPFIEKFFAQTPELAEYADFKYTVLYGRRNYLCSTRLKKALAEKSDLFMQSEISELERIANWALKTKTGLRDELVPPPDEEVWSWVNAESGLCTPNKCCDCFYQNAKKLFDKADVVILNHSLVFSLMASAQSADNSTKGILTADDFFVFDEAHLVAKVAEEIFGMELSDYGILRELKRIYNPRTKKGLLKKIKYATQYDIDSVLQCISAVSEFFAQASAMYLTGKDIARLAAEEWLNSSICEDLKSLKQRLDSLSSKATSESQKADIDDCAKRIFSIALSLEDALYLSTPKQVYWLETSGKNKDYTKICSAPLSVASLLRQRLFAKGTSVVMTSATLSLNGQDLNDFADSVGGEIAQQGIEKSPFNYQKNCRLLLCKDAPNMGDDKKMDAEFLADSIGRLISANKYGGTLVLFTSYYELNKTLKILREKFPKRAIFAQGEMSPKEALQNFKNSSNAVLLGTDAFWTGVDIAGNALNLLVITKLPFVNPDHPLAAAKYEMLESLGENPFQKLSLPEAVMKFRQGFGRLIRSESDKGVAVVLDSRILNKPYGKNFLSAIAPKDWDEFNSKTLDAKIKDAFLQLDFDKTPTQ